MAKMCPCDCGRKVPFGKGGAVTAFTHIGRVHGTYHDRAMANIDGHPPEIQDSLRGTVNGGGFLLSQLVEHLHGEARPGQTMDLLTISRAMKEWEGMLQRLAQ